MHTVICTCLVPCVEGVRILAMDIGNARIPTSSFDRLTQEAGIGKAILHNRPEPLEAKVNEIVVLSNDLSTRPGEVEGVRLFRSAKIVQLEDQVLGKERLVSPDDPANT